MTDTTRYARHAKLDADTKDKGDTPKPLTLQERKERDNALVRAANVLEVKARDLLHATHPDEVEQVERAPIPHASTKGPIRLALRALAREVKHQRALAVYREADGLYWALVLHWSKWMASIAAHRCQYGGQDKSYLLSIYLESAFCAAVRFDPSRDTGFSTYLKSWMLVREGRDPELATVVRGPVSAGWKPEMVTTVALDGPVYARSIGEEGGDSHGWNDILPSDQPTPFDEAAAAADREWLATLDAHLPHEQRVVLATLRDEGTLADAGRRLGVSRERTRQMFVDLRANLAPRRDDARANIGPTPCRWPRCRRAATVSDAGLCLDHHGRAMAAGVAEVFTGRVPSVDEVEAAVARVVGMEGLTP